MVMIAHSRSSPTNTASAPVTIALTGMLDANHSVSSEAAWPCRSVSGNVVDRALLDDWREAGLRHTASGSGRSRIRTWDLFLIREAL